MIVVRRDIVEAYIAHGSSKAGSAALRKSLQAWLMIALAAEWRTPMDVKQSHPKASILKRGRIVFNIKANDYRLVTQVNYVAGTVEIRFIGTHAEYDRINAEVV